jgi:hypothetical protein
MATELERRDPHSSLFSFGLLTDKSAQTRVRVQNGNGVVGGSAVYYPTKHEELVHHIAMVRAGKVALKTKSDVRVVPLKVLCPPTNVRQPQRVRFSPVVARKLIPSVRDAEETEVFQSVLPEDVYEKAKSGGSSSLRAASRKVYNDMVAKNYAEVNQEEAASTPWRRRYRSIVKALNSPIDYEVEVDVRAEEELGEETVEVSEEEPMPVSDDGDDDDGSEAAVEDNDDDVVEAEETVEASVEEPVPVNEGGNDVQETSTMGSIVDVETGRRRSTRLEMKRNAQVITVPNPPLGSFIDGSTGRRRSARLAQRKI